MGIQQGGRGAPTTSVVDHNRLAEVTPALPILVVDLQGIGWAKT
ncbi:hypothetical protein [Micromonospora sp. NPDC049679]